MKRILLTSTSGTGHLIPMFPIAKAAQNAGWEILLAAPPECASLTQQHEIPFHGLNNTVPGDDPRRWEVFADAAQQSNDDMDMRVGREIFGRLNTLGTLESMRALHAEYKPDVVVSDAAELSGGIAAESTATPWVRVMQGITPPDRFQRAMAEGVAELRRDLGLDPEWFDALCSAPQIAYFPESLEFEPPEAKSTLRIRDPRFEVGTTERNENQVYISLGTEAANFPGYVPAMQALIDATKEVGMTGLVSISKSGNLEDFNIPNGFTVQQWLDPCEALRRSGIAICHAGAGSILGALATSTPLIALPIFGDQPANAQRLQENEAALVVQFGDNIYEQAVDALTKIRTSPLAGTKRMYDEIAAQNPPSATVELIDSLV